MLRLKKRKIDEMLHRPNVPAGVFRMYFNWKAKRARRRLQQALTSEGTLVRHVKERERVHWESRIALVKVAPDNDRIPRHPQAGKLEDGALIMHNGLRVDPLSYYNLPMLQMLMENGAVHEPQEEYIFQSVLAALPKHTEKTMLELGAYWGFYSMWFMQQQAKGRCFLVEPQRSNLEYGKLNFRRNNLRGTFVHAGIGDAVDHRNNLTTVDAICQQQGIDFLDLLHADIQGAELAMIRGGKKMLAGQKVGYVFISTHSNELHKACREVLVGQYGFGLVAEANLDESYSWDGILVVKAPDYPGVAAVSIANR